ncbi:methyltransferase-like protein 2 isoform X1 [Phalaenopsis equestris]|uniref:methyltransferase-like protein 2 isoform X1 n=1 Tax=Phalaenopsis equestris TaxID=78828 RepID=UPI0009E5142F|nr:methyltransferase-like protein 2 isoform X1 [Phalaenopsis equestris]
MEGKKLSDELSLFLASGIYRLSGINAVFLDPVRLLNLSYSRHSISSSGYYCRTFHSSGQGRMENTAANHSSVLKKKKRKRRRHHDLNEKELVAERRHQELRPFLLKAHEALLSATELLAFLPNLVKDEKFSLDERELEAELKFIELGRLWQAPLYRISIPMEGSTENVQEEGLQHVESSGMKVVPFFNELICNDTSNDVDAEFLNRRYILPRNSCFYTSDLRQIHNLIPGCSDQGFNLIVIDPPWENGSAYQKAAYPTLPNRYLLYLPIKQLVHTEGALIVLWMTNRGKLRLFVEKELFPAWGVTDIRTSYWLKIKPDGSLLGDLGLIHHKPYEYLLLGYVNKKKIEPDSSQNLRENQILISIPGAYSRKPPLGKLLSDHVPGPKPSRCIELFARELLADWTSWGNEPLRFQDSRNFIEMKA